LDDVVDFVLVMIDTASDTTLGDQCLHPLVKLLGQMLVTAQGHGTIADASAAIDRTRAQPDPMVIRDTDAFHSYLLASLVPIFEHGVDEKF
jgi:hypothetical protein